MEGLYKNKYRVKSTRLDGWDYAWSAWYHVTICAHDKLCYFGKIRDNKMILNEIGKIAHNLWLDIPNHYPNVKLDYFVIMPNHVYGIIFLDNGNNVGEDTKNVDINKTIINAPVETRFIASPDYTPNPKTCFTHSPLKHRPKMHQESHNERLRDQPKTCLDYINNNNRNMGDAMNRVSTNEVNVIGGITGRHNPMLKNSLATIIRWYKGRCSYDINYKLNLDFKFYWQPNYHDSIINSEKYLDTVRHYIHLNPIKWHLDRNNPDNHNSWMNIDLGDTKISTP